MTMETKKGSWKPHFHVVGICCFALFVTASESNNMKGSAHTLFMSLLRLLGVYSHSTSYFITSRADARILNDRETNSCHATTRLQLPELENVDPAVNEDTSNDSTKVMSTSEASYSPHLNSPASTLDTENLLLGSDLGTPQVVEGLESKLILERITRARNYFNETVQNNPAYAKVADICRNKHELCAFWAVRGECQKNIAYMQLNCAPVCDTCDMLHIDTRCPMDPNAPNAIPNPGDLNRLFEQIASDPSLQDFEPIVLSRPTYALGDGPNNATYQLGLWMIMFDKAVTNQEADRLIELGRMEGYVRSTDVGAQQEDGTFASHVSKGRTSSNSWCNGVCYQDEGAKQVMTRIERITGIPEANSEYLQLLNYEQGQFYQTHNDYIPYQKERPTGVRVLTFYIYLNDVEEGGGTNFPIVNATVLPKKGRAVLWPSVLDQSPHDKDPRSDHQALPVIQGTKYGANAWIHQRDFKTPNAVGCQ